MSSQIYLLLTGYHIVCWTTNAFEIQFERRCHRSCHMEILCYALDNRIAGSFLCTQVTQVLPHTPTTLLFSPLIRFDSIRFDSFVLFACNRRVPLVVLSPSPPSPANSTFIEFFSPPRRRRHMYVGVGNVCRWMLVIIVRTQNTNRTLKLLV